MQYVFCFLNLHSYTLKPTVNSSLRTWMEESQEAQQCSASPPILLCHGIGISIFKILCSLLVMKLSSPAFVSSTRTNSQF